MREKLIELLNQLARGCPKEVSCHNCEYQSVGGGCSIYAGADYFIANGVTIQPLTNCQQWIPVTVRLPERGQRILVYCESKTIEKHVTSCTYMGGYLGSRQFSRHVRNVTHWMTLPEPPKEVE